MASVATSRRKPQAKEQKDLELTRKIVNIRRVSKTNKGGRTFGFSVLVVVGDGKGSVGFGTGKAKEIPEAVNKAIGSAKKSMIYIPMLNGKTLHHDVNAKFSACKVIIRSAPSGTGIIAGGAMRSLFEVSGIKDVVAKSIGASSNANNLIRATMKALKSMMTPKTIAYFRDKRISEINARRKSLTAAANQPVTEMTESESTDE